jgi:hypothetical protein
MKGPQISETAIRNFEIGIKQTIMEAKKHTFCTNGTENMGAAASSILLQLSQHASSPHLPSSIATMLSCRPFATSTSEVGALTKLATTTAFTWYGRPGGWCTSAKLAATTVRARARPGEHACGRPGDGRSRISEHAGGQERNSDDDGMEYGSVRLRRVRGPTADVLEVCKVSNGAGRLRLSSTAGVVSRSVLCGRGEPGRGSHGAPDKAEAVSFVFADAASETARSRTAAWDRNEAEYALDRSEDVVSCLDSVSSHFQLFPI